MSSLAKIRARPKLESPVMLAAWPGVGNVSMILASYLLKKLAFKPLGEIEASYFFDPIGVVASNNVVQAPQFPQSRFHYRKAAGEVEQDLILFIGDDQPAAKVYELAGAVLDVGITFQVEKVITCAAALTRIHFTEQPRVWGVATSEAMTTELQKYDLIHRGNLQIAGLNGLLLGVAKEREINGICLLGEVPAHASRIENPMAALAILEVLATMLGIEVDTAELSEMARETREQIKQATAVAMGEYIEHFTQPIWQQGDNGEEFDDEEDEEEG
ncbi:MAG: PAC2 family protein [Dehalococcoidales bacterium]|nr:MAG: PAC2 family protein [Dehalococcoidales bacterium]